MLSGVYRFPLMESVVFGRPYAEALAQEVDRLDARAVFILASGTLARGTDLVERLRQTLGNRFAGLCAKIGAHTPRTDVVNLRQPSPYLFKFVVHERVEIGVTTGEVTLLIVTAVF